MHVTVNVQLGEDETSSSADDVARAVLKALKGTDEDVVQVVVQRVEQGRAGKELPTSIPADEIVE